MDTSIASVLISSHDKDAAIFTFRGANGLLDPGDVPAEAFRVDLVYVSTLSNRSAGCFPLIVERAKAAGAYVVVNPGIRQLSARMAEFRGTLANLDLLILNRAEAEVLLPLLVAEHGEGGPRLALNSDEETPRLEATGLSGGGYKMSLAGFMGALRLSGPRSIAVTDSQGGSFVSTEDKIYYCPIVKRAVVGTAGAGDAFGATFASFIIQGFDVEIALRFAAANAACVVGHVDTQSGLQTRQALEMLMASDLGSLPVRKWVSPPAMRGDAARA